DCVDAQAVHVVLIEPEESVPDQKTLHFTPAVIEHERIPIRLLSLARIGVLVEMRAVEITQARFILRKVRRNPVENDSNSMLVEVVDQEHEISGRPETAGWRKVSNGLVTPGAIERMLGDRKEFDVRKASRMDIVGKLNGHLPVS